MHPEIENIEILILSIFPKPAFHIYLHATGTIEIPVLRHGSDLSSVTSVWCATRPSDPPSASPGVDYIPSSKKVEFKPGKTEEVSTETSHLLQNPHLVLLKASLHRCLKALSRRCTEASSLILQD